jgi:hypothetical protein
MSKKRKEIKKEENVQNRVLYFLNIKDTVINIYQIFRVSKPTENYNDNKRIKVEYLRNSSEYFECIYSAILQVM